MSSEVPQELPKDDVLPVVGGRGAGSTPLDAFDDALADANVHNYNLVELSSILPPGTRVERRDAAPGRWPVGSVVALVYAAGTTEERDRVAAGVGWSLADDGGIVYEATASDPETCERKLRDGLAGARRRRDWSWTGETETLVVEREAPPDDAPPEESVGGAVAVALFGPLAVTWGPQQGGSPAP